jgi:hypothetical protein
VGNRLFALVIMELLFYLRLTGKKNCNGNNIY